MSTYVARQKRDFSGVLRRAGLKIGLGAAILVLWGCPLRKPPPPPPELPQAPLPAPSARDAGVVRTAASDGTEVTDFDLDHDGKVEIRLVTAPEDGGPGHLVRKELDMNGDGRPDLIKQYGPDGSLVQERYDANFDGQWDAVSDYQGALRLRSERDEDGDGRRETTLHYRAEEISRVEVDADGDGRAELREEWRDGRITERLEDLDGDGVWAPLQPPDLDAGVSP